MFQRSVGVAQFFSLTEQRKFAGMRVGDVIVQDSEVVGSEHAVDALVESVTVAVLDVRHHRFVGRDFSAFDASSFAVLVSLYVSRERVPREEDPAAEHANQRLDVERATAIDDKLRWFVAQLQLRTFDDGVTLVLVERFLMRQDVDFVARSVEAEAALEAVVSVSLDVLHQFVDRSGGEHAVRTFEEVWAVAGFLVKLQMVAEQVVDVREEAAGRAHALVGRAERFLRLHQHGQLVGLQVLLFALQPWTKRLRVISWNLRQLDGIA